MGIAMAHNLAKIALAIGPWRETFQYATTPESKESSRPGEKRQSARRASPI
jgi:hypothetical protein